MPKNICSVDGCQKYAHTKGYCRNHYAKYSRTGNPLGVFFSVCQWPNCTTKTRGFSFCAAHKKIKRPAGEPRGWYLMGDRNPRWNGGISPYKDHGEFKRNRRKVLEDANYICADCGGHAVDVHHKDRTKTNHDPSNLLPLCKPCHCKYREEYTSKFKRLYGHTMEEISQILNLSIGAVHARHKKGTLSLPSCK